MKPLTEYKNELKAALPRGAFVRVSRGSELFISNAPRIAPGFVAELPGYTWRVEDGLMRITPLFEAAPMSVRETLISIYKAGPELRQKLIRQGLALALRQRDESGIAFFTELMQTEEQYEA